MIVGPILGSIPKGASLFSFCGNRTLPHPVLRPSRPATSDPPTTPTTMPLLQSSLLLLAALLGAAAGERQYLNPPEVAWTATGSEAKPGNGLFVSPDGDLLVGSFLDGSLIMYNPETGEKLGSYTPDVTSGATIRGFGGVTFAYTGSTKYLLYAVTENPFGEAQT